MNYPLFLPCLHGRRVAAGEEGEDLSPSLSCQAPRLHRSLTAAEEQARPPAKPKPPQGFQVNILLRFSLIPAAVLLYKSAKSTCFDRGRAETGYGAHRLLPSALPLPVQQREHGGGELCEEAQGGELGSGGSRRYPAPRWPRTELGPGWLHSAPSLGRFPPARRPGPSRPHGRSATAAQPSGGGRLRGRREAEGTGPAAATPAPGLTWLSGASGPACR